MQNATIFHYDIIALHFSSNRRTLNTKGLVKARGEASDSLNQREERGPSKFDDKQVDGGGES